MNVLFSYKGLERVSKYSTMDLERSLIPKTTAVPQKMLILLLDSFPAKYHSVELQDLSTAISVAALKFHL
jgi:hypothetical protein